MIPPVSSLAPLVITPTHKPSPHWQLRVIAYVDEYLTVRPPSHHSLYISSPTPRVHLIKIVPGAPPQAHWLVTALKVVSYFLLFPLFFAFAAHSYLHKRHTFQTQVENLQKKGQPPEEQPPIRRRRDAKPIFLYKMGNEEIQKHFSYKTPEEKRRVLEEFAKTDGGDIGMIASKDSLPNWLFEHISLDHVREMTCSWITNEKVFEKIFLHHPPEEQARRLNAIYSFSLARFMTSFPNQPWEQLSSFFNDDHWKSFNACTLPESVLDKLYPTSPPERLIESRRRFALLPEREIQAFLDSPTASPISLCTLLPSSFVHKLKIEQWEVKQWDQFFPLQCPGVENLFSHLDVNKIRSSHQEGKFPHSHLGLLSVEQFKSWDLFQFTAFINEKFFPDHSTEAKENSRKKFALLTAPTLDRLIKENKLTRKTVLLCLSDDQARQLKWAEYPPDVLKRLFPSVAHLLQSSKELLQRCDPLQVAELRRKNLISPLI